MGEPLTKQPLVEALCELQFSPSEKWDITLPGLFYAQVKDEFPERTTLNPVSFQFAVSEKPFVDLPQPSSIFPRLQLKRSDSSVVVQIGSDLLVVNHLQPYTSWENFRDLILRMFNKYVELLGEVKLQRIGLRYINHISPPNGRFEIEQFLSVFPIFPSPLNLDLVGFSQVYEFQHIQPKGLLKHQTGVVQKADGKLVLLVDLDFISQEIEFNEATEKPQDLSHCFQNWLNQAHDHIESAFIASLNPDYYELLK
ncbi:MAG: TIGR04255 family protein [Pseudanabaena sp.]|jgi:uncharacterized protein (TIGR04255 family)|uniref:TIGR04255 family protein n=1 Tax=Cyanophyceae TaxID=3028117 RepID=UPI000E8ED5DF|nr:MULTISPECIES: TIGR04255 family protein [Cyanophyceae]MCA6574761.1 TIGR04255 family protein [Pseudanabaena sp. M53BS1SP1A06MG]MCA6583496.1 TIGR04255 family protein [Pseudanabaena sp. M34BS1SP1A06MG]MCA6585579.1 TIGR04255 family protein [Pseudanabaena sp. M051S1SP1A06QC]MCA6588640.1 TIGR04255 family protein [Pseudanabaena sp. M109S1SP1A06QC]MCA6594637.1 TIGR04255 family protein [Pseudanabaena sp. M38BS1SP1A06MG]MCA6597663.1 TIGR04255 family protein [Pseudanabaena sp. M046S1SP1A06QC]MCA65991